MRFHLVQAADIVSGHRHFCERWIGERVRDPLAAAGAARLVGALLFMPAALVGAFLATGFYHAGAPAMITAGAVLLALPMIFCAATYLSAAPAATGLAALCVYGGGLVTAASLGTTASPVVWLMAAALPIEAWLVRRDRHGILVGVAAAAVALFAVAFLANHGSPETAEPFPAVLVALGYAGFTAARIHAALTPAQRAHDPGLAALENAIDGVVAHLSADGIIRAISAKAVGHFGLSRQLLVGTPLLERVHIADRIEFLSMLADLRAGAETAIANVRLRHAGGNADPQDVAYRTFRLELGACHDEAGALGGCILIARDIGDDLAARKALELALEDAESVQISKNRFLASVSHELRTPLNSIIGFSDILLQEMFGKFTDQRQREYVELIQRSGTHLLSVVNAILDVSKIEAGNYSIVPEPFVFKEATAMAYALMAHQAAQKGVTLIDRVEQSNEEVVADRRAIQQILINLVSNAIKFTDKGGVVTIDSVRNGADFVFSVSDTGIGMSAEDLKKLGRPFFQIHNDYTRAYEGTGLGVSLVKGLVELHGGTLDIASHPGEGTVVRVGIPQLGNPVSMTAPRGAVRVVELKCKREGEGTDVGQVRKTG